MSAIVTLKKGEGRTIKAGGAWIFDNEIDTITGRFKNGEVVTVHDFDADVVQMEAVLPAQGQAAVLQPDALFAPAVVRTRKQGGKHSSDHQQRHREGGQGVAGYRCQQQAQPAGDAGRQKKRRDAASCGVHRGFWRQDKAGQKLL